MTARLQSVFDTAADLIASGDLDGTLARITERAAQQVRAPRFLLAVRPTPDSALHFHHKGFEADDARGLAERVLGDDGAAPPEHWLLARVRSHRHDYGALVAVHERGVGFFDHERELLDVYARYAATALDSATALAEAKARHEEAQRRHEEAQRRYEESRTLLELARRLARAGSSEQIAQQLADAVPGVVDCDRASVYVWRPEAGELVREAINATDRGGDADAGWRRIRPDAVPQLADWLERPSAEPLFLDMETTPVRDSLREFGAVAAVAVPIATDERFLGCLVVSVVERGERLASRPELVDRLSGVAAHAVTALENGRLVDHITHQARHDSLTGAANRSGFHERLAAATGRAGRDETSLALFYVDLDDFKPINDEHGHEVGDELLCAVTRRLAECVRGNDTVARLGGDEFAVLVEGIASDAQLDAISDRLARAFAEPLHAGGRTFSIRASIGRAVSPGDEGPQALLRRADAAMYDVKRAARRA
jgi:diguanylate cyclase (GGDEF)-like protein